MAQQPQDLKYTQTHEWVRRRGAQLEVGITDFAQRQLADITFVELPEAGRKLAAGAEAGVVESIKAAADVYAPVAGVVAEANAQLAKNPELINTDPYGQGWLFRLAPDDTGAADRLMNAEQYAATLPKEH